MAHSYRHTLDLRVDDVESKPVDDLASSYLPPLRMVPRKKRWTKNRRKARQVAREAKWWHDEPE